MALLLRDKKPTTKFTLESTGTMEMFVCTWLKKKKVNFFIKLNYSFPEKKTVCFVKNKLSFALVKRYIGFIHFVKSSQPSRAYSYYTKSRK